MNPFRRLVSALVAIWLRDNPYSDGEKFEVDEHGVAVNVIIQRAKPEYVAEKVEDIPVWTYA